MKTKHPTPQQKRELMSLAECDPRTVTRWLNNPESMKPTTRARLDRAWAKIGKRS